MNSLQQTLAIALGKRDAARATLTKYKHALHAMTNAEQLAQKAEGAAQANLVHLTQEKIKTGVDGTRAARSTYSQAMLDLQIATTEREAAEQVCQQAEHDLDQLTKAAHRASVEVAKALAAAEATSLRNAARSYGQQLARHRALICFARGASADSGLVSDPIPDLNNNNPLKLDLDGLVSGEALEPVAVTEQSMLDAKIGGAPVTIDAVGGIGGRVA